MTNVGHGPLQRVSGPRPLPRDHGLLQASNVVGSGVNVIVEGDEHWGNGVKIWPYSIGEALVFDGTHAGTSADTKGTGDEHLELDEFFPMVVVFADQCDTVSVFNDDQFRARAVESFATVEGAAVEKELLTGAALPAQPHLADGTGDFPIGNVITTPINGLAALEDQIARSGRAGIIHMSPGLATVFSANFVVYEENGMLRTVNGTTVIAGAGYADGDSPEGHAAATGWEEWIYATGPIDIRRTAAEVLPNKLSEAMDREHNLITYIVERYYVVDWDASIHAAVLVDRCATDCGTPPS